MTGLAAEQLQKGSSGADLQRIARLWSLHSRFCNITPNVTTIVLMHMQVCIAREMIPPGRVIWLERHKGARPAYLHASNSDSALHTAHHAPQPAGGSPVKYAVLRRNSSGWTNGSNGGDVADSASNWSHAGSAVSAGGSGAANGEGELRTALVGDRIQCLHQLHHVPDSMSMAIFDN